MVEQKSKQQIFYKTEKFIVVRWNFCN